MDSLLHNAIDLHVHCSPDVVPRAQDLVDLAQAARAAGMAGIGLKDHTTSTVGRCHALNRLYPDGPRFYSSIALNTPVGGINPAAVQAALLSGADIVYFPTYSARHHIETLGPEVTPVPHPAGGFEPLTVLCDGKLTDPSLAILDLIADHDAVLATGHLATHESLALLDAARRRGVNRMIVTHASEVVPAMNVRDQASAVAMGALIEHSFLAVTDCCPGTVPLETIRDQIRQIGAEHVVLSSDFGQPANGPPIQGFGSHLERLAALGLSRDELRMMICDNPRRLVERTT